jgi:mannitol-1-phosphate/altronate dehydrogenase
MSKKAVIIGTGALALGFLGERLALDYEITFADKNIKTPLLKELQNQQQYILNICHLDGIESVSIQGRFNVFNLDQEKEKNDFYKVITEADIIFTTVGNQNLPIVISQIAPILNEQMRGNCILLCENGRNLAQTYQKFFKASKVVDTVMSRMCRFTTQEESGYGYKPLWKNLPDRLVVEAYDYLPLNFAACSSEQFSPVFTLIEPDIFSTWEDIKFFAHNGTHAFIAYHAFLDGIKYFSDVDHKLKEKAEKMLFNEIIPALHRAHPDFPLRDLKDYGENLLERIYNPFFHDSIDRGIRGILEKLKPSERLVNGLRFIHHQGIKPVHFASAILAGYKIISKLELLPETIKDFLINHCGIIEEELIQLIMGNPEI